MLVHSKQSIKCKCQLIKLRHLFSNSRMIKRISRIVSRIQSKIFVDLFCKSIELIHSAHALIKTFLSAERHPYGSSLGFKVQNSRFCPPEVNFEEGIFSKVCNQSIRHNWSWAYNCKRVHRDTFSHLEGFLGFVPNEFLVKRGLISLPVFEASRNSVAFTLFEMCLLWD